MSQIFSGPICQKLLLLTITILKNGMLTGKQELPILPSLIVLEIAKCKRPEEEQQDQKKKDKEPATDIKEAGIIAGFLKN
jgi:hypothetical protein